MPHQPQALLAANGQSRAGWSDPHGQRVPAGSCAEETPKEGAERVEVWLLSGMRCRLPGCKCHHGLQREGAVKEDMQHPC